MQIQPERKRLLIQNLSYCLVLALVLIHRYIILIDFGFKYVDSDQSIMWYGLKDFANGTFHEPRFYGQSYSTMVEALFAVPLYYLGAPPYIAVPIITSLFTLAPFIILSLVAFYRNSIRLSLLILSIPLLLSTEYSLITTIPRGFIPGVVIAGLGALCFFL